MSIIKEFPSHGSTFKISCVEAYPQHPSWFSFVDEQSVRDMWWDVRPTDVVFDVGAAYGSYSLSALAQGASMTYAWSPQGDPGIQSEREFMTESLTLNGWGSKCVTYGSGLYDRSGWLNTVSQEFHSGPPSSPDPAVIRVESMDSWMRSVEILPAPAYWMKVDVEGAEVEVIRGASELIRTLMPKMLIENHLFKRASIGQEVGSILTGMGYREVGTVPYHSVSHSLYVPS